jgi:hypothetical protein
MKHCVICGDETNQPVAAAFEHFHLYRSGQWRYLRGNIRQFGGWDGFWGTVGLVCPAFNTIRFWKLRRAKLVIPSYTDSTGKPLASIDRCPHGWHPKEACSQCFPS